MTTMKRTALVIMAIVLAVATVATAATAFAGEKKKKMHLNERQIITMQVAHSVQSTSQAILRLKVRNIRPKNETWQNPYLLIMVTPRLP